MNDSSQLPTTDSLEKTPLANSDIPEPPTWFTGSLPLPEGETPSPTQVQLWLSRTDLRVCTGLALLLICALIGRWHFDRTSADSSLQLIRPAQAIPTYRIDINQANWVEFTQLDGIGPALAQRIVEDRESNGIFHHPDELDRVKGIGPKTLERLRPYIRVQSSRTPIHSHPYGRQETSTYTIGN